MLLKFRRSFINTKHLHAPLKAKKGERIGLNKANSFTLQLSLSYVQKEKNVVPYLLKILINRVWGVPKISSRGLRKNWKINNHPLHLQGIYRYSPLFKTEINKSPLSHHCPQSNWSFNWNLRKNEKNQLVC